MEARGVMRAILSLLGVSFTVGVVFLLTYIANGDSGYGRCLGTVWYVPAGAGLVIAGCLYYLAQQVPKTGLEDDDEVAGRINIDEDHSPAGSGDGCRASSDPSGAVTLRRFPEWRRPR